MKNHHPTYYIGIDVSKDKLDAHCSGWSRSKTFANNPAGLRKLAAAVDTAENIHLVCEATGGYEQKLIDYAHDHNLVISRVNARQVRDFARAKGRLAKTDQLDASVIREYAQTFTPAPTAPASPVQKHLCALSRRRENLVRRRAQEKVALEKSTDSFVRKDIRAAINFLTRRIVRMDAEMKELIASDEQMSQKQQRMEQVRGVGFGASSLILAEVPELGTISDNQAAALIGLAPMNRDSGKWRGTRTIQGGRAQVRRGLYMPALSATTHNPILKEFYQRLRERGKPHHVALTAVMRKLIALLNRILANPDFQPQS